MYNNRHAYIFLFDDCTSCSYLVVAGWPFSKNSKYIDKIILVVTHCIYKITVPNKIMKPSKQ